jgi:16S rRNA (cytosine967-C5)-methyltransferase
MNDEQRIPLWRQLQAVSHVLQAIRQGQSGTAALAAVTPELRPGVQALSFEVLRSLGRAQGLRQLLAKRSPPPLVDALLCSALALLWRAESLSYDAFTLVNQAVECAKKTPALQPQAAFVNACLRRFLREREALVAQTEQDPVARWNHPLWWIKRLQADWPKQWQSLLAAADQHPPMTLRVNARHATPVRYLETLQAAGIAAELVGTYGVTLQTACPVQQLPGFAEGQVSVQDSAAQLAAPLLLTSLKPAGARLRVLDACAAPGGKTAHLLELSDAEVTALDMDPERCQRIHQTLQRLKLQAQVIAADAAQVSSWWDGQAFDAILLDAPCSASGIVRRHPDIRWLRRPGDIDQLAAIQARLLQQLWPLLTPGGRLLYCSCSVFRAEGELQVAGFLSRHADAKILPSPGHLLPHGDHQFAAATDNPIGDHDGFYYALLEKTGA